MTHSPAMKALWCATLLDAMANIRHMLLMAGPDGARMLGFRSTTANPRLCPVGSLIAEVDWDGEADRDHRWRWVAVLTSDGQQRKEGATATAAEAARAAHEALMGALDAARDSMGT